MLERARIVLASADGQAGAAICRRLGVSRPTVSRWLDRYEAEGAAGLLTDRPRPGRPKQITPAMAAAIIEATLHTPPPDQGTDWSTRGMAAQAGVHQSTVSRLWRAHGVKPHVVETFKISTDPKFVAKLRDVVGLYPAFGKPQAREVTLAAPRCEPSQKCPAAEMPGTSFGYDYCAYGFDPTRPTTPPIVPPTTMPVRVQPITKLRRCVFGLQSSVVQPVPHCVPAYNPRAPPITPPMIAPRRTRLAREGALSGACHVTTRLTTGGWTLAVGGGRDTPAG
ncbi:MAG: IS630 family transposase [Gemmatimonadaceae bacterium]